MLEHFSQGTRLASTPPLVMRPSSPQVSRARSAHTRGFTIPELLAVVIIIGLLAAVASPAFINIMRDRRVNKNAMEISGLYRLARSRALGRGNAVVVRWRSSTLRFEVRETIVQRADSVLAGNCSSVADWLDPAETQEVTHVSFAGPDTNTTIEFFNAANGPEGSADICFSPTGKSYFRNADASPFALMTGVPHITVKNTRTQLPRTVFIPPNGVARLAL